MSCGYNREGKSGGTSFPSPVDTIIVADYATLTSTYPAASYTNDLIWVAASSGIYFINYHPAGWYISNGTTWIPADPPESSAAGVSADTTGFTNSSSTTVQSVLSDFDSSIGGGGSGTNANQDIVHATLSGNATLTGLGGLWTPVPFDTVDIDTQGGTFSTVTYRHTPNVAGYYKYNFALTSSAGSSGSSQIYAALAKNGVRANSLESLVSTSATMNQITVAVDGIVQMNGTTDYMEFQVYVNDTANPIVYEKGTIVNGMFIHD